MPAMKLPNGASVADFDVFGPLGAAVSVGKNLTKESGLSALLADLFDTVGPRRSGGGPGKNEISSFFGHGEDLAKDVLREPHSASEVRLRKRAVESQKRIAGS